MTVKNKAKNKAIKIISQKIRIQESRLERIYMPESSEKITYKGVKVG